MQYRLNVAVRLSGKTLKPGTLVSDERLREAGVNIAKFEQRKHISVVVAENNPDRLRAIHGVGPAQDTGPAKRDLGTAEVKIDGEGNETEVEKPARAEKTNEGLSADLLKDLDADALVASVMERVQEAAGAETAEVVGTFLRDHEDTKGCAIDYLVASYGDRREFEQMVVEFTAEKSSATETTEDQRAASEALAAHKDKRGNPGYTQKPAE